MQNIALALVCLAGASHGRLVQASMDSLPGHPAAERHTQWTRRIGAASALDSLQALDPLKALAVLLQSVESSEAGFTPSGSRVRLSARRPATARSRPAVLAAPEQLDRRSILLAGTAAVSAAAVAGQPLAAVADVRGANQFIPKDTNGINKFLKEKGLEEMKVPDGFSPLCNYIGYAPPANVDGLKARDRVFDKTLLVRFVYPFGWISESPTITENGEAGTIAAGNYQKGDACQFLVRKLPEGKTLKDLGKNFFSKWVTSVMTDDTFEECKVSNIKIETLPDGKENGFFTYNYIVNTRAGFVIDVQGRAVVTIAGGAVVGIAMASRGARFAELEDKFKQMEKTFRVNEVKAPTFSMD